MPRPCKRRRIRGRPQSILFKPAGVPASTLQKIILTLAEFEALRLHDGLGKNQASCAEMMNISQPTFYRIISSARRKTAEAITSGKSIEINK